MSRPRFGPNCVHPKSLETINTGRAWFPPTLRLFYSDPSSARVSLTKTLAVKHNCLEPLGLTVIERTKVPRVSLDVGFRFSCLDSPYAVLIGITEMFHEGALHLRGIVDFHRVVDRPSHTRGRRNWIK